MLSLQDDAVLAAPLWILGFQVDIKYGFLGGICYLGFGLRNLHTPVYDDREYMMPHP